MALRQQTYADVRAHLQPGDVIAFGGDNPLSAGIMKAGRSTVSHAGVIVAPVAATGEAQYLEATVRLEGKEPTSVAVTTVFRDRLDAYEGNVWWLPLAPAVRQTFRGQDFADYVRDVQGKVFDIAEGALVVIRDWLGLPKPPITVRSRFALFCSELVVEALGSGGVVGRIDPAAVSPAELCRWRIFALDCVLLKGAAGTEIPGYNSVLPPAEQPK